MTNYKELPLIGTGFQHLIDNYFWNLPFASVRQCKYVLDKANIPNDTLSTKRAALAAEHNLPGAPSRDESRTAHARFQGSAGD